MDINSKCTICKTELRPTAFAGDFIKQEVDSSCPKCGLIYSNGEAVGVMKGDRIISLEE